MSSIPHAYREEHGFGGARIDPQRQQIIDRLQKLAWLFDSRFRVPGTEFRIGWDGLLGLLPGIGDTVSFGVSAYIVWEARRLGASPWTLARMVGNIVLDWLVGSIPVLGNLFDFAFKANLRNLALIGIRTKREGAK